MRRRRGKQQLKPASLWISITGRRWIIFRKNHATPLSSFISKKGKPTQRANLAGANMDLGPQLPIFHPLTEFPTESWKNMTPVITSGIWCKVPSTCNATAEEIWTRRISAIVRTVIPHASSAAGCEGNYKARKPSGTQTKWYRYGLCHVTDDTNLIYDKDMMHKLDREKLDSNKFGGEKLD